MRVTAIIIILCVFNQALAIDYGYLSIDYSGSVVDNVCYTNYNNQGVVVGTVDPDLDIDCCRLYHNNILSVNGDNWVGSVGNAQRNCCGDDTSEAWYSLTSICCSNRVFADEDDSQCACTTAGGTWQGLGGEQNCCDSGNVDGNVDNWIGSTGTCAAGTFYGGGNCLTNADCFTSSFCDTGYSQTDSKCCRGDYNYNYVCNSAKTCSATPYCDAGLGRCAECCDNNWCTVVLETRYRPITGIAYPYGKWLFASSDLSYSNAQTYREQDGNLNYDILGEVINDEYWFSDDCCDQSRVNDDIYYQVAKCNDGCWYCEYWCQTQFKQTKCMNTESPYYGGSTGAKNACVRFNEVRCTESSHCLAYEESNGNNDITSGLCVYEPITYESGTGYVQKTHCMGWVGDSYRCAREVRWEDYNCNPYNCNPSGPQTTSYDTCRDNDCGVDRYNDCRTSACGVDRYNSCRDDACGTESYCSAGIGCGFMWLECCGYSTRYQECRTSDCGVDRYNSCRASACGVDRYNECSTRDCGCSYGWSDRGSNCWKRSDGAYGCASGYEQINGWCYSGYDTCYETCSRDYWNYKMCRDYVIYDSNGAIATQRTYRTEWRESNQENTATDSFPINSPRWTVDDTPMNSGGPNWGQP